MTLSDRGTAEADGLTFLHVGCGAKRKQQTLPFFATDAWREVTLDIDRNAQPDIIDSMPEMALAPTEAFDALFSSHNIEHVFPHEAETAAAAFVRVLKPSGFAVVTCPDLQSIGQRIVDGDVEAPLYVSPAGPISPLDILFGHRASVASGMVYMAHKTGYTAKSLLTTLSRGGFRTVSVLRQPKRFALWAVAWKTEVPRDVAEDFSRRILGGETGA